jgi:transcription antitermination factor NusG
MYSEGTSLLRNFRAGAGEQHLEAEPQTVECFNWYAVYTKSRHEKVVNHTMRERGIQSFLPLRNVLSQWKDRRKLVGKPLFPGYLFVRVDQEQLFGVATTNGVAYVLGNGIEPVAVPDEQVETVRRLVEGPYPVELWPLLQKGKRVRIIVGPLAGLETYIIDRKGGTKCHLVVTVDILGRSVAVELEPHCVEPIC